MHKATKGAFTKYNDRNGIVQSANTFCTKREKSVAIGKANYKRKTRPNEEVPPFKDSILIRNLPATLTQTTASSSDNVQQ